MATPDRWSRWARGNLAKVTLTGLALALLVGLSSSIAGSGSLAGEAHAAQPGPDVTSDVRHDTSPALRTMKPSRETLAQAQKAQTSELPRHAVPHAQQGGEATQRTAAADTGVVTNAMPDFDQNFEGVGNVNGVLPPDTQGDVGPDHYVQMINLSFAIYDKQGTRLYGPVPNTTLWQGFGGPCETVNGGDPITIYDEAADRWFMSQLAYPGGPQGFHACIAVSASSDPLGAYHRYDFLYSGDTLNDYPKFGVWGDAYYMTANDFLNAAQFTGVGVQAYERAKMLNGEPAQVVTFHIGDSSGIYGSLLPADAEGQALGFSPPAGAPAPFIQFDDDAWGFSATDRLLMWDFHVDWANPANSTFGVGQNHTPNRFFETQPFDSNLCNYARSCIPQPGTSVGLDAFGDRLLNRLAYRNFGDQQGLVLNHAVDVGGNDHAGIRWYQLANSGAGWSIDQQGTYAPDSDNRWMGSVAQDASGNLAAGYSVSSSAKFPSISVAGRLAGDPDGQLSQGENELIAGGGSQTHGASRWGDYAAMQVDPTDGCTFWFTTEYLQQTSVADWKTRIGSFKFPSCTAGPHGDLAGTVTDSSNGQPIAGALVSTSLGSTTTDSAGHYQLTLPAGTYDVTFSAFGYNTETATGVVITDGATTTLDAELTPAPYVTLSGKVTDGSGHGWPLYTRIEITGRPGGPIYTDPVTGEYSVSIPANATYSVEYTATLPGYEVVTDTITVGGTDLTHDVAIPIQATCTAPGYRFVFSEALSQNFNGGTVPPGWTVVDHFGNGETWAFNDPGGRGNLTGGDGGFAVVDSDRFGPGHTQDTSLVSPSVDLSSAATPVVRFNEDYFSFPTDVFVDVDVSTDGGATWQTAFHNLASRRGPRVTTVPIPQAGNEADVRVRWHYRSTFGWWWEVDNAFVGNRSCDPIPGGLVVGNVYDTNTEAGLNGATVTSDARPVEKATTSATPDDPNVDDGYYWLFSSLTGPTSFTASKSLYQSQTKTVDVAPDSATRADFSLASGRLEVSPTSLTSTQVLGTTKTATLNITNTGTAPAEVELGERKGSFQILTMKGSPLLKLRLGKGAADPGWLGNHVNDERVPGIDAGPPSQPTWLPIEQYPTAIMDNSADQIDGTVYSVGGFNGSAIVANGYAYDPGANTWSAIANMSVAREKPGAGAIGGKLYVSGGWSTSGNPLPNTEAFDPGSGTWESLAANPAPRAAPGTAVADDQLYLVGGCADSFCTPSNSVVRYDPAGNSWETLAPYPHTTSWLSCGGIDGRVYCAGGFAGGTAHTDAFVYDPGANLWSPIASMPFNLWGSAYSAANGMLLVSSGLTVSSLTNQGLAYDPGTDSWSALPNAQFPRFRAAGSCGFYKLGGSSVAGFSPTRESERLSELDQCGVTDVPWLAEDPTAATIQPGQSLTVVVTFSATTAAGVTQPGTYTAQIVVSANTPTRVDPVDVTMNVTPPRGWGKVAGTVTGTACNGDTAPLRNAQVQANGKDYTFSLKTDAEGKYAFWAPSASNPFTIIASKDGWIAQSKTVNIKANKTTTVNFSLQAAGC
jgi:Carboxypeptidase regulatory-like domain/Kelch motif